MVPKLTTYVQNKFKACLKLSPLDVWESSYLTVVKSGSLFQVLPFASNETLEILPCPFAKVLQWNLLVVAYCMDVIYMATVARNVTLDKYSGKEFANFFNHFSSRLTGAILAIILAFNRRSLLQFSNALIRTRKNVKGTTRIFLFLNF